MAKIKNPIKITGYEKFWNVLTGAGAGATLTVVFQYLASIWTEGYITAPDPAVMTAAIGTGVVTVLAAVNAYMVPNSPIKDEVKESNTSTIPEFKR